MGNVRLMDRGGLCETITGSELQLCRSLARLWGSWSEWGGVDGLYCGSLRVNKLNRFFYDFIIRAL